MERYSSINVSIRNIICNSITLVTCLKKNGFENIFRIRFYNYLYYYQKIIAYKRKRIHTFYDSNIIDFFILGKSLLCSFLHTYIFYYKFITIVYNNTPITENTVIGVYIY